MIIGSLLLLGLFKFPLWNIMLGAPQYPEPLGMYIHIDGLRGVSEFDIQNNAFLLLTDTPFLISLLASLLSLKASSIATLSPTA